MSLFVRTSNCAFQCTKRVLHDFVSNNFNSKRPPKSSKFIDAKFIVNNDTIINKKLKNNEEIADDHWSEIRKELLITYQKGLSETSVDSFVCDLCEHHNKIDQAKNYFKFLERNNYNIPLSVLARYLRLLSRSKEINEAEEEEIFRICDHIREKYSLLDSRTCANYILALTVTKRWSEAFKMLDILRLSDTPRVEVVSALCNAAFIHNKPELAWKLMNEFIEKFPMDHRVYLEYLQYCKRNFKSQYLVEEIEKIFYFWRENYIIPVNFVLEKYMETFLTLGYNTTFTSIHNEKKCSECHTILQKSTLSASDFKTLSLSVLKKLIIGENIYQSASPQELKRYMLFIKTMQPYDVVIDGLNVAYATVTNERRGSLDNILQVVNKFRMKNKRVLVVGRAHMRWWSVETMKKLEEEADVFLLKNVSQDDTFLLHLTLVSGPQTYFVSQDLMRQHINKFEESNMRKLFKHWQLTRQYVVLQDKKANKVKLIPPVPMEINTQKVDNGWHIPCTRNSRVSRPMPELCACLMKKESLEK